MCPRCSHVELLDDKPATGNKRKAENQEVDSPVSAAKSAVASAASAVGSVAKSAAGALTGAAPAAKKDGEELSKAAKKKLAKKQKLESGEAGEGIAAKVADKAKEVVDKAAPKKEDAKVSKVGSARGDIR